MTDPKDAATMARARFAFAIVKAARNVLEEPENDTWWLRLEEAVNALDHFDALDALGAGS